MLKDYQRSLSVVIGLGFTAALVDSDLLAIYQPRLNLFIQYGDFIKHPGHCQVVSIAQAEMINDALYLFEVIRYPNYYCGLKGPKLR